MCRRRNAPPTPLPVAPPIQPRIVTDDSELPEKRKIIEDDEIAAVEYGSTKRKTTGAGTPASRTGTGALRIRLNTGGTSSGTTAGGLAGGMNV